MVLSCIVAGFTTTITRSSASKVTSSKDAIAAAFGGGDDDGIVRKTFSRQLQKADRTEVSGKMCVCVCELKLSLEMGFACKSRNSWRNSSGSSSS